MKYAEAEGDSIDEAIARALQLLGVSRDKVDIEIVSNATRGLFGLGGRSARVRATLRRPLALDPSTEPDAGPRGSAIRPRATSGPRRLSRRVRRRHSRPPPHRRAAHPCRRRTRPRRRLRHRRAPLDGASVDRARTVLAEIVRSDRQRGSRRGGRDAEGARLGDRRRAEAASHRPPRPDARRARVRAQPHRRARGRFEWPPDGRLGRLPPAPATGARRSGAPRRRTRPTARQAGQRSTR